MQTGTNIRPKCKADKDDGRQSVNIKINYFEQLGLAIHCAEMCLRRNVVNMSFFKIHDLPITSCSGF